MLFVFFSVIGSMMGYLFVCQTVLLFLSIFELILWLDILDVDLFILMKAG